jgi:hypothetical protein
MRKLVLLVCLMSFGLAASARGAEEAVYLFDLMARQPYRYALNKLLAKEPVPDWVKDFLTAGAGVGVPGKTVEVAGKTYRLDHLCKVHDCAGHVLAVLWAQGGQRVWAAIEDGAGEPMLFGKPSPDQAKVLSEAAKS